MKTLNNSIAWDTANALEADPIAHGSIAEAWPIALADALQVALVRGAMTHYSAVVGLDNRNDSAKATPIPFHVPPMVDRIRVAFLAAGSGSVYFSFGQTQETIGSLSAPAWDSGDVITVDVDTLVTADTTDEPIYANTGSGIECQRLHVCTDAQLITVGASSSTHTIGWLLGYSSAAVTVSAVALLFSRSATTLDGAV